MPSPTKGARFGGSPAHERLMLANLATALFEHGRITTTAAKARRLRPYAERLITKAKRGDLHNRREVMRVIRDKAVVHKLFADIGPFFDDRAGGYTRITKTMPRKGDNAPMAIIELVQQKTVTAEAERARRAGGSRKAAAAKAETKPDTTDETTAEDTTAADTAAATETTDAVVEESASTEDAPYGEGSHAPLDDDSQPEGFPIKGNASSMLYHGPDSPSYKQTKAEVWFATPEAAEAAGFSLPASMQDKDDAKDES